MHLRLFWLGLLLTGWSLLPAQDTHCGTMDYLHLMEQADPDLPARMEAIERFTQTYVQQHSLRDSVLPVITIPVVVHVVYANATENISDAQVLSQIDVLNEDFRRLNADTAVSSQWAQAADFGLEFCLADLDPDGFPTNGITRTPTTQNSFGLSNAVKFDAQGGKDAWPSDRYLNIWVCDLGNSLLGYAQFPGGNPATDGVVITYQHFGRTGTATPPFHLGRTATHEVGHWLNLRHIWGDGGCGVDDGVADTPLSDGPNYGCTPGHVSCGTVDMVENYMDYGNDNCLTAFTAGQRERSMALFAPGGARASLLDAGACCPETTCPRIASLEVSSPSDSSLALAWPAVDSQATYLIRYRLLGDSLWTEGLSTTGTSFLLDGLNICGTYEVQVASACAVDTNTYCAAYQATTLGCCEPPANPALLQSAATIAQINWQAVYGVNAYEVRYRAVIDTAWTYATTPDTTLILPNLQSCMRYEFQVKSQCDTLTQGFSPSSIFHTRGCVGCEGIDYCTPGGSSTLFWVSRVQLGALDWASAQDGGYANQSTFSIPLYLDSLYDLVLKREAILPMPHDWAIWLDLNRDGTFDEVQELVYSSGPVSGDSVTGTLYLPDSVQAGRTRMRVAGRITSFGGGNPLTACGTVTQGEYEDFCVELRYRCRPPARLQVAYDSLAASYALNWNLAAFSNGYEVRYREESDTAWTVLALTDTAFSLPEADLLPCARYLFEVQSTCNPDRSPFITTDTVLTRCTTSLEALLSRQVRLYPNPSPGRWTVAAPAPILHVRVYDLMGRLLQAQPGQAPIMEMEAAALPAGIYLIEVETTAGRALKRLRYSPR